MHNNSIKPMLLITVFLAVNLCACQSIPIPGPSSVLAKPTPYVTIQGEGDGKEEIQTIEIDNCDGKSDATRIEQRSHSVEVTISAEIAARLGASAEVISAEVQATAGSTVAPKRERSTSIQLAAPPKTRMIFQILWTGKEQIGFVQNLRGIDIPIAFRGFTPTDVRIKSQSDIGCPGSSVQRPIVTSLPPQPVVQPTAATQQTSVALQVFANRGWQSTNISIAGGNRVIIEYVSDLWFTASGDGGGRDASGGPNYWTCSLPECHEPLHDFPKYALIGRIGDSGNILRIGNRLDFVSETTGMLYLRPNYGDVDMPVFNPQGAVTMRVTVR